MSDQSEQKITLLPFFQQQSDLDTFITNLRLKQQLYNRRLEPNDLAWAQSESTRLMMTGELKQATAIKADLYKTTLGDNGRNSSPDKALELIKEDLIWITLYRMAILHVTSKLLAETAQVGQISHTNRWAIKDDTKALFKENELAFQDSYFSHAYTLIVHQYLMTVTGPGDLANTIGRELKEITQDEQVEPEVKAWACQALGGVWANTLPCWGCQLLQ